MEIFILLGVLLAIIGIFYFNYVKKTKIALLILGIAFVFEIIGIKFDIRRNFETRIEKCIITSEQQIN